MKKIKLFTALITALTIFVCGCSRAKPDAAQNETGNTSETTTTAQEQETAAAETDAPAETVPNNWYVEGYEVPEDWVAVMTQEEAFEHYDRLTAETQEGKTVEEIVETLVNRNILVFEIFQGNGYEFKNDYISSYEEPQPITSELFDSFYDLAELVNGTYISEIAEGYRLYNGSKAAFFEQDGELYVDLTKTGNWSSDPFKYRTYIEVTDVADTVCTFIWHYVAWEYFDYEYNDTDELYSHHCMMTFHAVRENGEWRLTCTILNNPALDQA